MHHDLAPALHYSDATMSAKAFQIAVVSIIHLTVQARIKENITAQRLWPLWSDQWIPRTKAQ